MIYIGLAIFVFLWLLFGMKIISFGAVLLAMLNRKHELDGHQKLMINYIFILGFVGWIFVFIRLAEMLLYY